MRKRWWILALTGSAALAGGCAERERDNPFDPRNPVTGGQPPAIGALAGDARIDLSWDLTAFDDIVQVGLERAEPTGPPQLLAGSLELQGSLADEDVANGTTYAYQLVLETRNGARVTSIADRATPGASRVWVADALGLGVARLTPDGRDLLGRYAVGAAFLDLTLDLSGSIWAADFFGGQIVQLNRDGGIVRVLERPGANTLVHDPFSAQIWVGSYLERSVSRYSVVDGRLNLELPTVGATEDLEVEPFPGSGLWVGTRDAGLLRVSGDRVTTRWEEFLWPVALARDPAGVLWVVDRGAPAVSRLLVASDEIRTGTAFLVDPRDCALDGVGGLLVADPGRGGVVHLDSAGAEVAFWELAAASAITRDPLRDLYWVVFREVQEIGVYDREGREQARGEVTGSPVKVEGFWE